MTGSGGTRNGHLIMARRGATGIDGTYYPDVSAAGTDNYGDTTTIGNSDCPSGTRARIYAVYIFGQNLCTLTINTDPDGTPQFVTDFTYNAANHSFNLGPEGLQIDDGFEVVVAGSGAAQAEYFVVWELD